jgi:hypothetical protein
MQLGAVGALLLFACSPQQRDLSELKQFQAASGGPGQSLAQAGGTAARSTTATGSASTAAGGATFDSVSSTNLQTGGVAGQSITLTNSGGNTSVSSNGLGAQAGVLGLGSAPNLALGGSTAVTSSSASLAGSPATSGGTSSEGGRANGGVSGSSAGSSARAGAGGGPEAIAGGSGWLTQGGAPSVGGSVNAAGGAGAAGGRNVAGSPSTTVCVPSGAEVCHDGLDNDCNGFVDCPVINGRFPEPGRASAGDDAWASLAIPFRPIRRVECRSGRPDAVANKLWQPCDEADPTALKVYSMAPSEAAMDSSNGITRFEFRFVYDDNRLSEPSFLLYYAHNSLIDSVKGTSTLQCPPLPNDARLFAAAAAYVGQGAPAFAAGDLLLKNPFIRLKFTPDVYEQFVRPAPVQDIKVLSIRHRFVVDPTQTMLLVTRLYQSLRSGSCEVAVLKDHVHSAAGATINKFNNNRFYAAPCTAIVMNKRGAGVCLGVAGDTISVVDENSSVILGFLDALHIPWPKADPLMWQRLFDDRPARSSLQFFSNKCLVDDAACRGINPGQVILLPNEANDRYFTTP